MARPRRTRRTFGAVRRLPSGKWQARLRDPDTARTVSIGAFDTKAAADAAIAAAQAEQRRSAWVSPARGRVSLGSYVDEWLKLARPRLRPRTYETYAGVLERHVLPHIGGVDLADLSPAVVRRWHSSLLAAGIGAPTVAKAYRVLRGVMNTAVSDELIVRNPCAIKGAASDRSKERPVATIGQVMQLADAVEPRFRALVLLAAFCCLRESELFGLTRKRVNVLHRTVSVAEAAHQLEDGTQIIGPPKTDAGTRSVAIPAAIVRDIEHHLNEFVEPTPDSLLFTGANRAPMRRNHWGRSGGRPPPQSGCRGSTSTICGTPATRLPPPPERALVS